MYYFVSDLRSNPIKTLCLKRINHRRVRVAQIVAFNKKMWAVAKMLRTDIFVQKLKHFFEPNELETLFH